MPRPVLHLLVPVLVLLACAKAAAADQDVLSDTVAEAIPVGMLANGDPTTSAIFRNELTQVDVTDERGRATDFDGLYNQSMTAGSGVSIRQKVGDQFLFKAQVKVGMAQSGSTAAGAVGAFNQNFQGQAAANQAAYDQTLSAENRWSAAWTPSDRFSLSYSSYESQQLDDDRTLAQVLSGDNTLSAKWTAGSKTTLTLSDDRQKSYDWGTTGYDTYETTALGLSQGLGANLTWNFSPGWLKDTSGGTNPYDLTGPQLSSSFDWAPITGTKWTLGGAWNRLDETDPYSNDVTAQTTRSVFVAYDRAVSKNMHFQLRSDYSNLDAPRGTAANVAEQDQFSFRVGQHYSLNDTFTARVDVSQTFQQQDRQAWTTSASMATLSLQKNF